MYVKLVLVIWAAPLLIGDTCSKNALYFQFKLSCFDDVYRLCHGAATTQCLHTLDSHSECIISLVIFNLYWCTVNGIPCTPYVTSETSRNNSHQIECHFCRGMLRCIQDCLLPVDALWSKADNNRKLLSSQCSPKLVNVTPLLLVHEAIIAQR